MIRTPTLKMTKQTKVIRTLTLAIGIDTLVMGILNLVNNTLTFVIRSRHRGNRY